MQVMDPTGVSEAYLGFEGWRHVHIAERAQQPGNNSNAQGSARGHNKVCC